MNIGCLFGTFDPPHNGHVAIAEAMRSLAGLDEVWLVVTPLNPFKQGNVISSDEARLRMTTLAVQGRPGLRASDAEMGLPQPNYTVDTLARLRGQYPGDTFSLIMGSDNLASLHRWKGPEAILANHRILVYPRPGVDLHRQQAVFADHASVQWIDAPLMDLSSTRIRNRVREGEDINDLVPAAVRAHIIGKGLYKG
ncbi:MAG: nicotinate (nicotinamide) nucleotide adenylyltransferase [Flavobacteriales bacterium]